MHKNFLTTAPQLGRFPTKATVLLVVLSIVPFTVSNDSFAILPCLLAGHATGFLETPALLRLVFFAALS
jgi:hypothetical protein